MKTHQWQQRKYRFTLVDDDKAKRYSVKYVQDGNYVLDIGCGDCVFFDILSSRRNNCKLYGFDIVSEALDICRKKGYFPVKNLKNLKDKFDIIAMFECFEHLTYEGRLEYVRFVGKRLKRGGYFIISFPHISSMFSLIHYSDNPEHKMPYPIEANLKRMFGDFDFVDKIYFNPWLNPLKVLHCLITGLSLNAIYNNVCYILRKK